MAKEGKSFATVERLLPCIGLVLAVAVIETVYLHWKSTLLEDKIRLLARLHGNVRQDLDDLATAIHRFQLIDRDAITGKGGMIREQDAGLTGQKVADGRAELHRKIRSYSTAVGDDASHSGTNVANVSKAVMNQTGDDAKEKSSSHPTGLSREKKLSTNESLNEVVKRNGNWTEVAKEFNEANYTTESESRNASTVNETESNIVRLTLTSDHEGDGEKPTKIERCASAGKAIRMNIDLEIDGDGNCHCSASTTVNGTRASKTNGTAVKPRVTLPASRIKGAVGKPIEIRCDFTGGPILEATWLKGSSELEGKQYLTDKNRSLVLSINNPNAKDNGFYTCQASSSGGSDEKTTELTFVETDCSSWMRRGHTDSGMYAISPDGGPAFEVFCDMETGDGGWNVIQRRQDGSVDFFRGWNEYRNGFGNKSGEFWLGNDKIHRLTAAQDMALRFDLTDSHGTTVYAQYDIFHIGDERSDYRLHVASFFGTAGDSFLYHGGMKFSTRDKNYNILGMSCAERFRGAWWYRACHRSNLNGEYQVGPTASYAEGIKWMSLNSMRGSLARTEMKIKPRMHSKMPSKWGRRMD